MASSSSSSSRGPQHHRGRAELIFFIVALAAGRASAQVVRSDRSPALLAASASPPGGPPPSVAGAYVQLGMGPIAVAHAIELPCANKFLMIEFGPTGKEGALMLPHPPGNPEGRNILQVYDRDADTWTNVPNDANSVCGGWARFSNGKVGLFAGHYKTLKYVQSDALNAIRIFNPTMEHIERSSHNLTAKRWYPTTLTLPNGDIWVPGGTWDQKKNGVWPRAPGADIYVPRDDSITRVALNKELQDAGLGNWYMGALVLPTGGVAVLNKNMAQVVNPRTGEALARAPPLPASIKDLVWEFPRMGAQVHLQAPVMRPGTPTRVEFVVFGGSTVDAALDAALRSSPHVGPNRNISEWKPCADVAVRIGLVAHPDGRHVWDAAWQVERMPDRRCIADAVVLPNGHVVIVGGQRVGLGDLTDGGLASGGRPYAGGHDPHNEAWVYKPSAPPGQRFVRTGAKTKIARMYHATSLLTKEGDVWIGGTSNARFWTSPREAAFSRTPLHGTTNEYRNELYRPSYLYQPNRPRFSPAGPAAPTFVPYGAAFEVGYAFDAPAEVTGVVLLNAGGVTHNYAIGHRSQLLAFTVVSRDGNHGGGVLRVEAPPTPDHAPPAHYLLFLLSGERYSAGQWLQLRRPPREQVPVDYPSSSRIVPELSATFEPGAAQPFRALQAHQRTATSNFKAQAARGSGESGARVAVFSGARGRRSVALRSGAARLRAGSVCHVQLWARASAPFAAVVELVRLSDGNNVAAERAPAGGTDAELQRLGRGDVVAEQRVSLARSYCLHLMGPVRVPSDASYALVLDFGQADGGGTTVDVDDVETYCT